MNSKITAILASVVILLAGGYVAWTVWPHAGNFDPEPSVGAGQELAKETARAVNEHGRVVAVIGPANQESVGIAHVEWTMFQSELQKHTGVNLAAPEIAPPNSDGLPGCSAADFRDIVERHAQADAIVFFMPLPPWSWFQSQVIMSVPVTTKVIVLSGPTFMPKSYYTGYFTNGILSALIVGRMHSGPDQIPNPKTPEEKFHNEYQIFTPQNFESLPE